MSEKIIFGLVGRLGLFFGVSQLGGALPHLIL
jgi:hypothetical protein